MSNKHFNTKNPKGHLNFKERELIERWLKEKKSQADIARLLGRSPSTISHEIKRGTVTQIVQGKKTELYLSDFGDVTYFKNRHRSVSKGLKTYSRRFWNHLKKAFHKGWFKGKDRLYSIKTFVLKYARDNQTEKVPCFKTIYRYICKNMLSIKPQDLPMMYRLSPRKNKYSKPKGRNKKVLGNSYLDTSDRGA